MDVGLRAVSWVVALDLIRGSQSLDDAFWSRAYAALFDHGLFTRGNLENTYEVTSNHFLSNVVGLWFMAAMFDDVDEGRAWSAFARESLETEINVQVLPDGADFESSVPYHRLVAELFLGSARLADHRGQPLSPHYRSRVHDMVGYLAAVTRPDGLMPQSGDADDGRLHVFGDATATPQDARHLFGPASVMCSCDEWMSIGGPAARWEVAWWGLGTPDTTSTTVPAVHQLFPDAGHAVVRDGGLYLLITNGIVGTKGFGNHKHNDQLAFEYHAGGRAVRRRCRQLCLHVGSGRAQPVPRYRVPQHADDRRGGAERVQSRVAVPDVREGAGRARELWRRGFGRHLHRPAHGILAAARAGNPRAIVSPGSRQQPSPDPRSPIGSGPSPAVLAFPPRAGRERAAGLRHVHAGRHQPVG